MKSLFSCMIMLTCASAFASLTACDDDDDDAPPAAVDAGADASETVPPATTQPEAGAAETSTVLPAIAAADPGTCRFVVDGVTLIGTQTPGSGGFGTTATRSDGGVGIQCIATAGDVEHTVQISATGPVAAPGSYTGIGGAPKPGDVYVQTQYSPITQGVTPQFYRQTAGAKIGFTTLDARAVGTFDVSVTSGAVTKVIQGAFDLAVSAD